MIMHYITPKESVILNVLAAEVDFTTCESIVMSQEVDEDGDRTLAVVTKVDRAPDGLYEKIQGNSVRIGLGYVCVRNKTDADASHDDARRAEAAFFNNHPELSQIEPQCLGIPALAQRLTEIQAKRVADSIPRIRQAIQKALVGKESELQTIPFAATSSAAALGIVSSTIQKRRDMMSGVISGKYGPFQSDEAMHYAARLHEKFNEFEAEMRGVLPDFLGTDYSERCKEALKEVAGISLPNMFDQAVVQQAVASHVCGMYPGLNNVAHLQGLNALRKAKESASRFIQDLLTKEEKVILTLNHYYMDTVSQIHVKMADFKKGQPGNSGQGPPPIPSIGDFASSTASLANLISNEDQAARDLQINMFSYAKFQTLSLAFSNALPSPHKPSVPFFFSPPLPPHHILPFPPPPFSLPLSPPLLPPPSFSRGCICPLPRSAPFQLRPSQISPPPAITFPTPPCGAASRSYHASTAPPPLRPVPPRTARQRLCRSARAPAHSPLARPLLPLGGYSAAVAERADRRGRKGRVRAGSGWVGVGKGERQQGSDLEEEWGAEEERDGEDRDGEEREHAEEWEGEEREGEEGEGEEGEGEEGEDDLVEGGSVSLDNGSATAAHGLPSPAVAVRNLVEQVRAGQVVCRAGGTCVCLTGCPRLLWPCYVPYGPPSPAVAVRNLVEQVRGVVCVEDPIFLLSPLSIHTRNMLADPRCTLVVQIPGWSGLANARATIFGDVYPVPPSQQQWAQRFFARRHHHGAAQMWGNFSYYRMQQICDIYFVGGFGTVAWIDVKDYLSATPDAIVLHDTEAILHELNVRLGSDLKRQLASILPEPVDDALFISIDGKGVDIRVRHGAKQRMAQDLLSHQPCKPFRLLPTTPLPSTTSSPIHRAAPVLQCIMGCAVRGTDEAAAAL
ncbi:unnamed protein product [Closterium sp. Naga37s-1]|nr:unnamed protein product [Closterium sp. Naga37s-1]